MPAELTAYPRLALKRAVSRFKLARSEREAQAILASYPKSGRTWLRFILSNYLNEVHGLALDVDLVTMFGLIPNRAGDDRRGVGAWRRTGRPLGLPLLLVAHERYTRQMVRGLPVVMMVRNPLDVLVSSYFHRTRHRRQFTGDVQVFLRDETYGLPALIAYHNAWGEGLLAHRHLVLSYEELYGNSVATTGRVVAFLGWPVREEALAAAVDRSTFARMRELEQSMRIPGHSYDMDDEASLRMRSGKVGGHAGTIGDADRLTIAETLRGGLTAAGAELLSAYSSVWRVPSDPPSDRTYSSPTP